MASAPAPSQWWRNDPQRVQSVGERLKDAAKREQKTQAAVNHAHSKAEANKAWEQHNYAVVVERLNESIAVNSRCDVLRRYRSAAASMAGNRDLSVRDARTAISLNPRGGPNHACAASCLERERRLHEAATHRLEALRLGLAGSSSCPDLNMRGLIGAVRRDRAYPNIVRPKREKILGGGLCRPDIFDSLRQLDMSYHTAGQVMEPDPPVLSVERTTSESLHLTWEAPKDDGGGEIYQYVIEIAAWDCAYEPARNGFFEDFREWTVCHTGPAKVLQTTLENLVCDNPYRLRAKASNEAGDSPWTDVTLTRTAPGKKGLKKEAAVVPRSWLAADLPDIMAQQQQLDAEAGEPTQFVRLIGDAFKPWVFELRRVFKFYVTAGAGNASRTEMSPVQFLRFCKDCGLAKGEDGIRRRSAPTAQQLAAQQAEAAGEAPPQVQAVQLSSGEVSLMFQRANMENLQSRSKSWKTAQALAQSAQQAAGTVAAEAADDDSEGNEDSDVEDDTKDSGAKDAMAIKEWIGALSRLAWACLPEKSMHIGERLNLLLTAYIIPAGRAVALKADPLEETLTSRRVVSLMEYFAKDLAPIFKAYAAADQTGAEAQATLDSINMAELLFMLKEANLLDDNLTVSKVGTIFTQVNVSSEEVEGGDEEEAELVFDEFVQVVVRICNAKIPPEMREPGEEFVFTLQRWLKLIFIPKFKQLVKDKQRGIGSKTL